MVMFVVQCCCNNHTRHLLSTANIAIFSNTPIDFNDYFHRPDKREKSDNAPHPLSTVVQITFYALFGCLFKLRGIELYGGYLFIGRDILVQVLPNLFQGDG